MKYSQISFIIFLVIVFSSHISMTHCVDGKGSISKAEEDDIEIERQLRVLNKKPVKTITTKVGDIIDCVDIYKQPAFDNPLLKDHKIQMIPRPILRETTRKTGSLSSTFRGLQSETCPSGTVAIRRTTRQELVNAKYFVKKTKPIPANGPANMGFHFVSAEEVIPRKKYFGAGASMSLHNLTVDPDQSSTSHIWIMNGARGQVNSIEFGLMKNPSIFGDSRTRLFGYWTRDEHRETGCYNILCAGFVQIHWHITFGNQWAQSSTYDQEPYDVLLYVHRANDTHWWLHVHNEAVGYWPSNIFTNLGSASSVRYGGFASATSQISMPQMGNGHIPQLDNFNRTAFMSQMMYANEAAHFLNIDPDSVHTMKSANPRCYDIKFAGQKWDWGITMAYGGPGGPCDDSP
ncbi:hypothetical protein MKW94_023782 [Papaver nudicaule]|uniref:Neprosin PEP catalytic domain-containing protein n=1 Tax=Papaver nudicaule TaxID=74823 RepID=A0AA41SID7_PAPNU|nr:hypothetical protein [Papaver nudicaule]